MLTVKFLKYGPEKGKPSYTESICIRTAESVTAVYAPNLKTIVKLGDSADAIQVTVGEGCEYSVAYVTNEAGRTVETIR